MSVDGAVKKKANQQRYFNIKKNENNNTRILKKENKEQFNGDYIKIEDGKDEAQKPIVAQHKKKIKKEKNEANSRKMFEKKKITKIPTKLLAKYSRGQKVDADGVKTNFFKEKLKRKEIFLDYAVEQSARTELLLQEEQGFLQADDHEVTSDYRQTEIVQNVDIQAASKRFTLKLDFGPYKLRYTKNGRDLLLGGRRGHVAAFDWITKKLRCEMNVMEEVADVCWLHVNTMFACAQKDWVRIYDIQGTELHCLKRMYHVNRMEFLPYHFLLASVSSKGYACWVDVSIGEIVGMYQTHLGDIRLLRQNPANGVLCIGGGKGVVSMWSPKVREPLAKVLVHTTSLSALAVDPKGQYLVTAGLERKLKVWDVRKLSDPLVAYTLALPANQIDVSQRGILAFSQGNICEMYSNLLVGRENCRPYLRHKADSYLHGMRFCPYEDVLGLATATGFESLLVPGAGEPNFDALEDNPFQTKKQRREHEVHSLLEKIPAELIALDPKEIAMVDEETLQEKIDAKRSVFYLKPPKIDFKSKHKMKGRGGSVKAARNKQIVKDLKRKVIK